MICRMHIRYKYSFKYSFKYVVSQVLTAFTSKSDNMIYTDFMSELDESQLILPPNVLVVNPISL